MANNYWYERMQRMHKAISDKTIDDIEKRLSKYYSRAMLRIIKDFEATYDKIIAAQEEGKPITPADLYKLDRYWQMQGQLKNELDELGNKEIVLLSEHFERQWQNIYDTTAVPANAVFTHISTDAAKSMINQIWLADGKNFSSRIWKNINKLTETLNEELVNCVVTGKKTTELKRQLINRFNVSYNQADTLVRTEVANIQVQASAQKSKDAGLDEYIFFADPDERTCPVCGKLHNKKFKYSEMKAGINAPPMHPRCRCDILSVVDDDEIMDDKEV